ncbi:sodium/solute symporter [Pontibacter qinzhouensis]|uniref:Sodium/solute symporter n=1 Tax=Pontibacter qinzhouensis TaxID=2603253 RepID=A0A5C8KCW6_9BACT|nr:sodium:solute symporter [Pontibacter qinzhouensis]TXK48981.1 sodium/solute symporter [Pontibacter qinzhouensis]
MNLPLLDLIIFIVFIAGVVVYGCSFYFRNTSPEDYTTGGGKIPAWAVGMSIFATFVSSISFLALPGNAYLSNWNGFVFSLSIPIASFIAVKFFVPLYRSINSPSAYYYLETRFGAWARIYASVCYLLTQLARMGAIMYLLALPMNALFGWSIPLIIIITGVCVLLYSMMGGIEAVIWTDTIQGGLMIIGALVCLGTLMFSMPEGPGQLFEIAAAHDKFSLGSFSASVSAPTFWVILVYGLFINLQNYGIDQNYVQRYMTAKSEKEAIKSAWLGSLLYVPVSLVFFFIGTALFAYYQAQPHLLPDALQAPGMADKVFPHFIVHGLPTGVTGLLIASIFAAGMSTVSTSINSSATVILTDYYKRFFRKNASMKESMRVLYITSLIMGILSIVVALAMMRVESALDAWWALASIFSGGMLGLFLLGFVSQKVRNFDAAMGVVAGILVICWMSLSPIYFTDGAWIKFRSPFHTNLAIVLGTTAIFIVGFVVAGIVNRNTGKTAQKGKPAHPKDKIKQ